MTEANFEFGASCGIHCGKLQYGGGLRHCPTCHYLTREERRDPDPSPTRWHEYSGRVPAPCGVCGKPEPHAIHHNVRYPASDPREAAR